MRSVVRYAACFASLLANQACEFSQVTSSTGEPVLIVHAVLNSAQTEQLVLVENSVTGDPEDYDVAYLGLIPLVPARNGLKDALVTLTHLDADTDCGLPSVTLVEMEDFVGGVVLPTDSTTNAPTEGVRVPRGAYITTSLCALSPGDRVQLDVEVPDGRRVTGVTRIPGFTAASIGTRMAENGTIPFSRQRDSLWISLDPVFARAIQVDVVRREQSRRSDRSRELTFPYSFVTDTMSALLSGLAKRPLEGQDGDPIFHPGRYYTVTVATVDTSYYDFVRSGGDIYTGRGFINHLTGGIGVLGSVAPHTASLRVTGPRNDPKEAVYRMRGSVNGIAVDVLFEPYLNVLGNFMDNPGSFSAFFDGSWGNQAVATSVDGAFGGDTFFPFGQFPLSFTLRIEGDSTDYFLSASPADFGSPFELDVRTLAQPDAPVGVLSVEKVP